MIQKVKDKAWKDETGQDVPVEYVTFGNRLKERHVAVLLKESKAINKRLVAFKKTAEKLANEVFAKMLEEYKAKPDTKGNYTFFSFDRSVKVEVSVSDRIEFDDIAITACKEKLDEFLKQNLDAKMAFVKELVTDAFSTSRGKLDTKKVMSLLKYRSKIKDTLFEEALNLLESSIRRPSSKTYFRIFERQDDNSYKNIDLNFSNI